MLQLPELQRTLTALVKGKQDILLYGNKGSGKTTLATRVLDNVLGEGKYINIKCIFLSDRESLMYLFSQSLCQVLCKIDSAFLHDKQDFMDTTSEDDFHLHFQAWLTKLAKYFHRFADLCKQISRIYIFMDNVEEFTFSETFLRDFYYAFKNQFKFLKFSFFFCGITFHSALYYVYEPLRLIPSFIMPRPNVTDIIKAIIKQSFPERVRKQNSSIQKLSNRLQATLISSFESLEYERERIVAIARCFIEHVKQQVKNSPELIKKWIQGNQEQPLLRRLKEHGAITLERVHNYEVKKDIGQREVEETESTFYLENYPALFQTALSTINTYFQSDDKRRFCDIRKALSNKEKNKLKTLQSSDAFKRDPKKIKHARQRVIAVTEVLEEQSSGGRFKEKNLPHHSLDYYGCLEYLREEGYINCYGHKSKFGGIISGQPKESQVKDFMKKCNLEYLQFTGKDGKEI